MKTEIYPMPFFPSLTVKKLKESYDWYLNLGFKSIFEMKGADGKLALVHLRWSKYADLMLVPGNGQESESKGLGISLNFAMKDGTVDQLADHLKLLDYPIEIPPSDRPWNARDMTIVDLDGFKLVFTQPIRKELTFDRVIENIKDNL